MYINKIIAVKIILFTTIIVAVIFIFVVVIVVIVIATKTMIIIIIVYYYYCYHNFDCYYLYNIRILIFVYSNFYRNCCNCSNHKHAHTHKQFIFNDFYCGISTKRIEFEGSAPFQSTSMINALQLQTCTRSARAER